MFEVLFKMGDGAVEVIKLGPLDGGIVIDEVARHIEAVFEGIQVAGLAAAKALLGDLRGFVGGEQGNRLPGRNRGLFRHISSL